jgi:dihydrofolate reductase
MPVTLIAAVARNRAIGRAGDLVWRHREDMRHLRAATLGHTVVMGRRTWDSLPLRFRPLPDRRNLIVTRQPGWSAAGAEAFGSLQAALAAADVASRRVFVLGGGELYAAALPMADELLLTEIDAEIEGDTFFPAWPRATFGEVERHEHPAEPGVSPAFAFVRYRHR